MIPEAFEYHRPATVDEALSLLSEHGDDAKLLAGGHSLLPAMKLRLSSPGHLIDIGQIDELQQISVDGSDVVIGAGATHHDIESSDIVQGKAPVLANAASSIGDVQVRNMGTIGGSLAHADPAADYPAAVLAADARIRVKGSGGERTIAGSDFFVELYMTSLAPDEIVLDVRVPSQGSGTGSAYVKFPHPASRFAVCGCAASVTVNGGSCSDVRVGFTGIANAAFRDAGVEAAMNGSSGDGAAVEAAAARAAEGAELLSDSFAGEDYRRHLAKVFARHALTAAVEAA